DRLDFSGPLSLALTGAEARLAGFALEVEDGRWLLAANSAATSGLSLQSNSGKGYVKLDLEPSGRRLLLPGDQICDNKGRILLTLSS
ncbi:MAG: hypothetical protein U9Q39_05955, partial [Pseudomonadota bacterium]|nr:hypothetical protein [Pseudomonadota bacterium]